MFSASNFGAVVGVIQLLPLVEHVLGERAPEVGAGDRNRTHVMQAGRLNAMCELDGGNGPVDVCQLVCLFPRGPIVDSCEVEYFGAGQRAPPPRPYAPP